MTDLSMAPGCFGAPLIFKSESPICKVCPFFAECEPNATRRLAMLHAHYGIEPRPKKASRRKRQKKVIETRRKRSKKVIDTPQT